ncbi:GspE/PulE family protein [Acholeplasma equifetale]|uniref:GspE/PulE family protein n=1 Tax=Acholeplasma equifetale TaxID=264634 RepID=UPI000558BA39|nr:GspE/PulE family protein [Acholeplasma equifetale]
MYINEVFYKFLIEKNPKVDQVKLKNLLAEANAKVAYLYQYLINQKVYREDEMYELLSVFYQLPLSEVGSLSIEDAVISAAPLYFLKELNILPFKNKDGKLLTAISEPHNLVKTNQLKAYYKLPLEVVLVTPTNITTLFEYIENKQRKKEVLGSELSKDVKDDEIDEIVLANSPAVKLADSLLREAVASNVSDIHIEPFEEYVTVRFRIDGHLVENTKLPKPIFQQLLARFKIIANLNIAERRIPQDGKLQLTINEKDFDFRISTIPTIHGEKIVIRVYNMEMNSLSLESLGFFKDQFESVKRMIEKPYGIVLVTGPTGSGKTTTLYSFLKELNREDVNITTVEDPVENQLKGINQIQINPKANLTFSSALRAILRQDPNIIMIGEIRDEETAQMAIRAAITGHLVFSTLHTNDAVGAITRLMDMGVPRYLLADAISGSIAQRLARKLCPHCKEKVKVTAGEAKRLGVSKDTYIYKPVGCSECFNTGYRGRKAVFEVINFDKKLKKLIENQDVNTEDIRENIIKSKVTFLKDNFKQLVIDGVTSIEEYDSLVNYD